MQWQDAFYRFEFEDHLGVYDDVGEVAALQICVVVDDGQRDLAFEWQGAVTNSWQRQAW